MYLVVEDLAARRVESQLTLEGVVRRKVVGVDGLERGREPMRLVDLRQNVVAAAVREPAIVLGESQECAENRIARDQRVETPVDQCVEVTIGFRRGLGRDLPMLGRGRDRRVDFLR